MDFITDFFLMDCFKYAFEFYANLSTMQKFWFETTTRILLTNSTNSINCLIQNTCHKYKNICCSICFPGGDRVGNNSKMIF